MSRYLEHAKAEMEKAKIGDTLYGELLPESLVELLECFEQQGHSGMSANITLSLFDKLARFKPLTPLTGEDDEWGDPYGEDGTQQNKRCSHVFRDKDGRSYDIHGIVFEDENGTTYTGSGSSVDIEFPYTPETKTVKRASK